MQTKFKVHKIPLPDDYVIHAALYSLPVEFSQIKTAYNTQDETWSINSLISKCVAKEEKLKREKSESAYLISRSKSSSKKGKDRSKNSNALAAKKDETFKKFGNKHNTGNSGGPKGNSSNLNYYFCKKKGHKKAECRTLKVGNGDDVEVQHIGNVVLILDNCYELVLKDTFYIPPFRRNLVSISALDNVGYEFNFRNNKVEIFYDSEKIGECVLTGGLYKLCTSLGNECLHVENCSTNKRSKTKDKSFVLWHKRLGHISRERVNRLIKDKILSPLNYSDIGACVDCAKGKLTKTGKKSATRRLWYCFSIYHARKSTIEWGGRKPKLYTYGYGKIIAEALTAKFMELDVAENSGSQLSKTPESSRSVSIPLPSLTETFSPVTVREETVTLPALDEDHDLVPDIPQGHDPVPEIPQVHEPAQEIPLRRSKRERIPAISADYHVYLGEADYDIGHCIYMRTIGIKFIFLVLYVDDILLASSDLDLFNETKSFLSAAFEMKDHGEASYVLGD
ncbi:Retrovirus-related Pol polyprotein from transposon TNT 1-94 [Senna tora]|uniref:Retrovirus-related Pol polyprotein from transposon TNT 1-94 n=1 Tax=Senna tora TaxID=362788 RepID=A0A834X7S8_9FABA|nr:Retrovirus-related Pol polyprotein from transposon TNT 1-94 [Senna tora]